MGMNRPRTLWERWQNLRYRSSYGREVRWDDTDIWIVAVPVSEGDERPLPPLENWFVEVAFPAFETNETTLSERPNRDG